MGEETNTADARAHLQEARGELRETEASLRAAVEKLESLHTGGLRRLFGGGPDPAEVALQEANVLGLSQQRKACLENVKLLLSLVEELEVKSWTQPTGEPGEAPAPTEESATAELIRRLEAMARMSESVEKSATFNRRVQMFSSRFSLMGRTWGIRSAHAVNYHASGWDELLDETEMLADQLGVRLALPRRRSPMLRPPNAPVAPQDMVLAREGLVMTHFKEFGPAIQLARHEIRQLIYQCKNPRAASTPVVESEDLVSEGVSETPPERLRRCWTELDTLQRTLQGLAAKRASTMAFLKPLQQWQTLAAEVRAMPLARELELQPPINNGAPLATFIQHVGAEWPVLQARFEAWGGAP